MKNSFRFSDIASWLFGISVFVTGVLNIILIHPVPGAGYMLLSIIYIPPVNALLKEKLGFYIPPVVKIILGILIFMFTFGVSDLGDMID